MFTLLGCDSFVGFYEIPSYALVGEWFTAVIVIIYLRYPITGTVCVVLYMVCFVVTVAVSVLLYQCMGYVKRLLCFCRMEEKLER